MDAGTLYGAIIEVCPIISTSIGKGEDRATWTYEADPAATAPQLAAADNVIQTIPLVSYPPLEPGEFITRFTNAEYLLLKQKQQTDITGGDASGVRIWDIVIGSTNLDMNSTNAKTLKAALVTDGVITQERADAIFGEGGTTGAHSKNWVKSGGAHGC